jgi:hypothetical protein
MHVDALTSPTHTTVQLVLQPSATTPSNPQLSMRTSANLTRSAAAAAAAGKSYLIGYGRDQPKRPHHRQSACNLEYTEPCRKVENGTCCVGESGADCCNLDSFMSDRPAKIKVNRSILHAASGTVRSTVCCCCNLDGS